MDKSSFAGIGLAAAGIIGGLMLEGGSLSQIMQPTAAMIVLGGTVGAVMVQFPLPVVLSAFKRMAHVFFEPPHEAPSLIRQIIGFANKARKEGVVSLESQLSEIGNPVLRKSLRMAVDGTEPEELRKLMELELENLANIQEKIPQVFESAGGFAPTVGIIGAVLGLIQVMQHLDNITEVGHGIAVAFVATIYGVAAANLLFLPAAGKLKIRVHHEAVVRDMILEGVISILEGVNPRVLETKLLSFIGEQTASEDAK
ncbi:MAG: flagellar motor protein [Acidobacteriaceae bacterium]